MHQHHVRRAGGLGEVVRRQAQPPLGRRHVEPLAHGTGQEGVNRRALRPDAVLEPGQHQPVRPNQPGFQRAENTNTGVSLARGPDTVLPEQAADQIGEVAGGDGRQVAPIGDQAGQQHRGRLAGAARPDQFAGQHFQRLDQGMGGGVDLGRAVGKGDGGQIERREQIVQQDCGLRQILEPGQQDVAIRRAGAAQTAVVVVPRRLEGGDQRGQHLGFPTQSDQRMLEQGQQEDRRQGIDHPVGDQPRQHPDRKA